MIRLLLSVFSFCFYINAYAQLYDDSWESAWSSAQNYTYNSIEENQHIDGYSNSFNQTGVNDWVVYYNDKKEIGGIPSNSGALIQWVVSTGDHNNLPFLLADKVNGEILLIDTSGAVIFNSPALFGKHVGDSALLRQTPSGAFTLQQYYTDESGYDGDLMIFFSEGDIVFALHRTYKLIPGERRVQRLNTSTAGDNRITNGCINVPENFYNNYVLQLNGSRLYVLPETRGSFLSHENYSDRSYVSESIIDFGYTERLGLNDIWNDTADENYDWN